MGLLESGVYSAAHALDTLSYVTPEVQETLSALPKFSSLPEKEWTKDLTVLKRMMYMDVFNYLVERKSSTLSDRQEANYKRLKGYSHFASGWVENVWASDVKKSGLLYFRGLVYQSYPSSSKHPYTVYACLGTTGKVLSAECKPWQGLGSPAIMLLPC